MGELELGIVGSGVAGERGGGEEEVTFIGFFFFFFLKYHPHRYFSHVVICYLGILSRTKAYGKAPSLLFFLAFLIPCYLHRLNTYFLT